jgi:hypothetical protein
MHLTTTGLSRPELDDVPKPFENGYDCLTRFGEESVVVAGDEERNAQLSMYRNALFRRHDPRKTLR